MKIINQARDYITDFNGDTWTTRDGTRYKVMMRGTLKPELGEYETKKRADEVLCELYRCYKEGTQAYEMPLQ